MQFAAFFRNLNLGRAGAPDRSQFEAAFTDAGAASARSFQVNGSLVFEAEGLLAARRLLGAAREQLLARCGFAEPACCRPLAALQALPLAEVFADLDRVGLYELTVSFACSSRLPALPLPLSNTRGDAQVLWLQQGIALGLSRKLHAAPGDPNRLLEQRSGRPFTSRSLGTIERLLAKHGAAGGSR